MAAPAALSAISPDRYRPFGRTGLLVSPLGFGGAPIGNLATDRDVAARVLNTLLDHGVNVVDTAHAYHGSEEVIGETLQGRRDEYVVVTKCGSKWQEDDLPPAWTPEYVAATIDRSLRRLRTDVLDVVLLHSCDLATLERGDVLAAVIEARDAGKVRFAGYSGDNDAAAWAAAQPDIAVLQVSISICDQSNLDRVLPVAAEHEVGVMAKRPVANAAWKPIDDQYERYRKYAGPYHERFEVMNLDLDTLHEACGEAIDWPEVALRFCLSFPGAHTAIVGTTRMESVAMNLAAAAKGPLPETAVEILRRAWHAADPEGAWPGLT